MAEAVLNGPPKVFVAPWVEVGLPVQWMPERGMPPSAAIVVARGDYGVVHLQVFHRHAPGMKEAVRHQDDPVTLSEAYVNRHCGVWRHVPGTWGEEGLRGD